MARRAAERGDDGTNDLLVSDVIRTNELQVWFVADTSSIRLWSEQETTADGKGKHRPVAVDKGS